MINIGQRQQILTGLSQKTNGKREVTLVTCCNYSTDRLIIKAKEI